MKTTECFGNKVLLESFWPSKNLPNMVILKIQDISGRTALPHSAFGGLEMFCHTHHFQQGLGQALGALEHDEFISTEHFSVCRQLESTA